MSGKYTPAQKEATKRYLSKQKSLSFRIPEEKYTEIQKFSKRKGLSMRAFVLKAIEEKMRQG